MSEAASQPTRDHEAEEAKLFHEGIDLFNDGEWFEAHEVWEDIWHLASGDRKRFYQGLIQCAVTLEHARRGNPRGVRSVWASAQQKFEGLPDEMLGIEIDPLLDRLRRVVQPVLELPPAHFEPGRPHGQDLPIAWDQVPRIELTRDPFAEGG